MSKRKYFYTSISILTLGSAIGVLFNNCSKSSFEAMRDSSSFVIASTMDDDSIDNSYYISCIPNVAAKLISNSTTSASKYADDIFTSNSLEQGTQLVIKLDHKCIKSTQELGFISKVLKPKVTSLISDLDFGSYKYTTPTKFSKQDFEKSLEDDTCVSFVDKNTTFAMNSYGTINDTYYSMQKHLSAISHSDVYPTLFNSNNGINKEVRIAIIDSGVDTNNPDLTENILRDSYDKVIGLNAILNNNEVADAGFHGTHVAGLAAATTGNSIGVSGVLGNFVKIIPIRVSNDGSSVDLDAVINGINWAAKQKAEVINMSLSATGASGDRPLLREAIDTALKNGVTIVVAAGNDGQVITKDSNIVPKKDCNGNNFRDANGNVLGIDTAHIYPMKYASSKKGLISVGSIDATSGALSCFSNRSPEFVEILAPGSAGTSGIISTVPTIVSSLGYANSANGSPIQGTSMASPVAAGAAALAIGLAKSRGYSPSPEQIEKLLTSGSIQDSSLLSYAVRGQKLNLKTLVNLIDQDTHIQINSSTDRSSAYGVINLDKNPISKSSLIGSSVTFEVAPTESSAILINYQWYRNGRMINGANSRTLTISNVQASHAGTYQVILSAGTTKLTSQQATLTVADKYCSK